MSTALKVYEGKIFGNTGVALACLYSAAGDVHVGAYLSIVKDATQRGWSGAEQEFRALFADDRSFFGFQGLFADRTADAVRADANVNAPVLKIGSTGEEILVNPEALLKGVIEGQTWELCRTLMMAARQGEAYLRVTDFSVGAKRGSVRFAFHLGDGADFVEDRRRRILDYLTRSGLMKTPPVAPEPKPKTPGPWFREDEASQT